MGRWQITSYSVRPSVSRIGSTKMVPNNRRPSNSIPESFRSIVAIAIDPVVLNVAAPPRPPDDHRTDHPACVRRIRTGPRHALPGTSVPGAVIQSRCPTPPNSTSDRRTSATLIRTSGSEIGGNGRRSRGSSLIGDAATGAVVVTSLLPTSYREQANGIIAGNASAKNADRRLM